MAWETPILDIPCRASANVSAIVLTSAGQYSSGGIPQYRAVLADTSTNIPGDIILSTSAATTPPMGILQNRSIPGSGPGAITTGESAQVRVLGVTKVTAAAALNPGALVMSDSTGQATASTTTNYYFGMTLSVSSAVSDIITVLLMSGYQK
jgi:hypothetical protein